MDKTIKTMGDVKTMLSEILEEIEYFANSECQCAAKKVIADWGFDLEDFKN